MDLIELDVRYGNRATEEWENVAKLEIDHLFQPDFSVGPAALRKRERSRFRKAAFPNSEGIDVAVVYRAESTWFALNVHQDGTALQQLL